MIDNEEEEFQKAWNKAKEKEEEIIDKKLLLDIARKSREQEISLIWQRAQFFWALNTVALGGIGFLAKQDESSRPFVLGLAFFGFITSLSWTLTNRGSKYWYENWEARLVNVGILKQWFSPLHDSGNKRILMPLSIMLLMIWILTLFVWPALLHQYLWQSSLANLCDDILRLVISALIWIAISLMWLYGKFRWWSIRLSPSKILIATSDIVCAMWVIIVAYLNKHEWLPPIEVVFSYASIVALIYIVVAGCYHKPES